MHQTRCFPDCRCCVCVQGVLSSASDTVFSRLSVLCLCAGGASDTVCSRLSMLCLCAGSAEQRPGAGVPGVVHVPGGALCAGVRLAARHERRAGRVCYVTLAGITARQLCNRTSVKGWNVGVS